MKNKIFCVLKKELREVFRDKKSLSMMLLIPIMIPLILVGVSALFDNQINRNLNEFNKIGFAYELNNVEKELIKQTKIKTKTGSKKEMQKLYKDKEVDVYIEKKDNNYIINYDKNNETSSSTVILAEKFLEQYKLILQDNYLKSNNLDSNSVLNIIDISYNEIGEKEDNFYVNYITTYAFIFIIMAITISATYPATDATAGEKERGTLETLLTFPIKNRDIIIGKYLSVSISSIITGVLGFILSLISLIYISKTFSIFKGINLIPSLTTIIITILIIISYSLLISGLCIAVASLSKSFKEAQSALTPITFISIIPGMIAFMANIKTTALISIIPFLNYVQIFNDINSGNINYLYIFLMFVTTLIYISIVLFYIIKQYRNEKILFTS